MFMVQASCLHREQKHAESVHRELGHYSPSEPGDEIRRPRRIREGSGLNRRKRAQVVEGVA